jgi:hypothetical protein
VNQRPLRAQRLRDGSRVDSRRIEPRLLPEHRDPRRHRPRTLGIEHHVLIAAEPPWVPRVELVRQVRLADARHPLHRDERHAARAATVERGSDARKLGVATDEDLVPLWFARMSALCAVVEAPAARAVAQREPPSPRALVQQRVIAPEEAPSGPPAEPDLAALRPSILVELQIDHLARVQVAMRLITLTWIDCESPGSATAWR